MEEKSIVIQVSNLERSSHFYHHVLDLTILQSSSTEVLIESGGAHPNLLLKQTDQTMTRSAEQPFHFSVNVHSENGLKEIYKRSLRAEVVIVGFPGTNVMPAIYLEDPDGNIIEAGVDLPPVSFTSAEWSSALWSTSKWLVKDEKVVSHNRVSPTKKTYLTSECEDPNAKCIQVSVPNR